MDEIKQLIADKREEYKDAEEMKDLFEYLDETEPEIDFRYQTGELDEDWLKAVEQDVKRLERYCKGMAGLLPPNEQEAFVNFRKFFLGPSGLPDYLK